MPYAHLTRNPELFLPQGGNLWTEVDIGGNVRPLSRQKQHYARSLRAVELNVLMGHAPAKVDEKGRIKMPSTFRKLIEEKYGPVCFITSFEGDNALIYPMGVWMDFQARLAKVPSTSMAKARLLERANYYGQLVEMDAQGRLLVPSILRSVAEIADEVVVIGNQDHLIVWNNERIQKRMKKSPLTQDDFKELELHGV